MEFTFEDFKNRALDSKLSKWEKIGFPDNYRSGVEQFIFEDFKNKLNLDTANCILDIGCGCSELVEHLIEFSNKGNKTLLLVDSNEMLLNIDKSILSENIKFLPGKFPNEEIKLSIKNESVDAIIAYSVLQYIFIEQNIFNFIHECIKLLKPGGRLLLGDIPNFQSRERFLASENGKKFLLNKIDNTIGIDHVNEERIDDGVIFSILLRYRQFGCETYLMPQPDNLPFANRREDILIVKR